jgi:sulfatase maturation enzyme AslB (radical SAM superfamily)
MASFDTIDLLDGNVFQVTWDTGRRCNYDCSYCPAHRHDNFSPHATLDDLIKNADFTLEYINLYMTYRSYKRASISFTGGEPTVNPAFIPFAKYIKQAYKDKYKEKYECSFALTSNGAMGEKMATQVMENFDHITISYHAEADPMLKQQVRDRMVQFATKGKEHKCTISINVMFHAAYFEECIDVCKFLDSKNIKYVPRIIGEEPDSKSNFAHMYTAEQTQWFKDYWANNTKKVQMA